MQDRGHGNRKRQAVQAVCELDDRGVSERASKCNNARFVRGSTCKSPKTETRVHRRCVLQCSIHPNSSTSSVFLEAWMATLAGSSETVDMSRSIPLFVWVGCVDARDRFPTQRAMIERGNHSLGCFSTSINRRIAPQRIGKVGAGHLCVCAINTASENECSQCRGW